MRHVHLSRVRRAAIKFEIPLAIIDYDSAELGLRQLDAHARVQAADDLRAICRYACGRRHSSKTGSILILRFFLGYYLSFAKKDPVSPWVRWTALPSWRRQELDLPT
jgi:hypothetical protein